MVATGVCIPIGNSEVLLAALYKPRARSWSDADGIELLSFRNKSLLSSDLNAKNPVWNSQMQTFQVRNFSIYLNTTSRFQHHNIPLTIPYKEMVTCSILWCTGMSDCQMSVSLASWTQGHLPIFLHILNHVRDKDNPTPAETHADCKRFWSLASEIISPRIRTDTVEGAEKENF
jgi:hypothetical protein